MKALSIRQPWVHRIFHEGKDIENRDWYTTFRGLVLIHAGKAFDGPARDYPEYADVPRGSIVGAVTITDCVMDSDSEWFFGKYGLVLANPVLLPEPLPCKGMLGFFKVPDEIAEQIRSIMLCHAGS